MCKTSTANLKLIDNLVVSPDMLILCVVSIADRLDCRIRKFLECSSEWLHAIGDGTISVERCHEKCNSYVQMYGPGSSVGIATDYGLVGPGSNPGGDEGFPSAQTGPGAHPAFCKMGTGSFPGVKCGRGVLLTTHPLLVPRSWKSRAIPLLTLWATPGP